MERLLLATNNAGKIAELSALLRGLPLEILTPESIDLDLEVVEDGETYTENAVKKALSFARAASMVALADDTGLEVDALEGAPGLHSKRYTGRQDATDAERRAYLLERLDGIRRPWTARFHATIAVATPAGIFRTAEGYCEGQVIPEERGHGGFGYDQIFLLNESAKTMAELPLEEKNLVSHRAHAMAAAIPLILELLGD